MAQNRDLFWEEDPQEPTPLTGFNHLLAIGIDAYEHCTPLKNAVNDASSLAQVLSVDYGFPQENIVLVTNEEATEYRIFSEFRNLIKRVGPEDNVLIFFCGHGHYDEDFKQGYWIPVDARLGAIGDYIPNSEISTTIRAIPSRHTFMIADACFSGSLFGENRSAFARTDLSAYHRKVGSIPSRWGLASGRNEVVADGIPGENSPFTQNLLYFLKTKHEAPFAVSELVQYVKTATANNSEQTPIGSPLRNVGDRGGELVFYPKGVTKTEPTVAPPPKPVVDIPPVMPAHAQPVFQAGKEKTSSSDNPFLQWMKDHFRALLMIAVSTFFFGMWSEVLYWIVPATCLGLMASEVIFRLKGRGKIIFTAIVVILVGADFIWYEWEALTEGGKMAEDAIGSVGSRMKNHELIWFSLGLAGFASFLYFFFTEQGRAEVR